MNRYAEIFDKAIQATTDTLVDPSGLIDDSIRLFHLLAGALEWCDTRGVDFDATLEHVRESFAEDVPR